jgi:hypothetical protein
MHIFPKHWPTTQVKLTITLLPKNEVAEMVKDFWSIVNLIHFIFAKIVSERFTIGLARKIDYPKVPS